MLKVVGASWYKTRISSYILMGAFLLAVGFFFIADMERPQFDGTYCATQYWYQESGFRETFWGQVNELEKVKKGVARACYKDSTMENGWSQFEIETQAYYPDRIQALAAGRLEGALTWKNIYLHWKNTIESECEENEDSKVFCIWLRTIIATNVDTIKKMAALRGRHDHFWYQIGLFYDQLEGLEIGFKTGVKRSRSDDEIPSEDFLLLNGAVDIRDLKIYYKNFVDKESKIAEDQNKGQILLKILNNEGFVKILLGHTSDGSYSSMLRMLKKYTFNYHYSSAQHFKVVPGTNIIFTGYPGVISSVDDFYVVSGRHQKLLVTGVKIQNENLKLWENIDLEKSILLSARLMATNRLAHNGRAWAKYFARSPSTGAKQWLIVDSKHLNHANSQDFQQESINSENYDENKMVTRKDDDFIDVNFAEFQKKIADLSRISDGGLFWVVDQIPGRLHAEDVTEQIVRTGYWRVDGVPYFEELRNLSHVKANNVTLEKYLRNITTLDALAKYLRQQGYRGDLDKENPDAFGNIDMKLFSEANNGTVEFQAYSGPMYEKVAENQFKRSTEDNNNALNIDLKKTPFSWESVDDIQGLEESKHEGQPTVWNFNRVSPRWAWI